MQINQLIGRAATVYPDGQILAYWDMEERKPYGNPEEGDGLARFIVAEIADTFNECDQGSISESIGALRLAADELGAVAYALERLAHEQLYG